MEIGLHPCALRLACGLLLVAILAAPAQAQSPRDLYSQHFESGNAFLKAARPREALPHYRAAAELAKQIPGGVERLDRLFYNLAMAANGSGSYEEAGEAMLAVEKFRRQNLGDDHPETIAAIRWLAIFYFGRNNVDKAFEYSDAELALAERRFGKDSTQVSDALMTYGLCLQWRRKRDEQTQVALRCLAIREAKLGKNHYQLRDPLHMLSTLAIQIGEYGQAEDYLRRVSGLDPREGSNQTAALDHRAVQLSHVADLYARTGRYLEADSLYREVGEIFNKLSQTQPATYERSAAMNFAVAGGLHLKMGLPDKAMAFYSASCHLHQKAGADPSMSFALQGMGRCHHLRGELADAEAFYEQAFEVGKGTRGLALLVADVAALMRDQGHLDSAAEFFERAVKEIGEAHGDKCPYVLGVRLDQAELEALRGNRAAAEKFYRQALEMAAAGVDGNPDVATAQMGLARLALAAGERENARTTIDKARREMRRYTRRLLPALSEPEQLEFLADREGPQFAEAIALAARFPDDAKVRDTTAGWVLNAKGLAQEAIAQRTLVARGTNDPRTAGLLKEWLAVRFRLAQMSLAGAKPTGDAGERERELAALSAREQRLAGQLGRSSAAEAGDSWVELEAARQKLPKDAVLIEIVRHVPPVKKPAPPAKPVAEPARYLAWIIPAAGPRQVTLVDLGPADALDQAVAAARKPLLGAAEAILDTGETEAEQVAQKELAALSKKLLEPLRPHLAHAKHWVVSPDGDLWLVPWSALSLEPNQYLVESHVLQFVVSGRDLVELAGQKASGNAPLVLADPDFDLTDKPAASGSGEGSRGGSAPGDAEDARLRDLRRAAVRAAVGSAWQRLPGTAREAKDLEPKLSAYTGSKIDLHTGRAAAEQVVRDAWQPRVAVLSTHGYFLERPPKSAESLTLQSPLVRCGLVLAGANRRAQAPGTAGDDGILTGLEIVGADLRGTELVVLSACETGLGDVRAAEGVVGLRQAFQLAGAQSVLASLWRVPDADTAQLMATFYDRLAATGDKAGALRDAQLALLQSHRKASKSAHPYYWAAFTLTGRSDRPEVAAPKPRPARVAVRPRVRVISPTAPIMDGAAQVTQAKQGDILEITGEQGEWLLTPISGRAKPAWILKRHVQALEE